MHLQLLLSYAYNNIQNIELYYFHSYRNLCDFSSHYINLIIYRHFTLLDVIVILVLRIITYNYYYC